jgi:thiamine transport system permease protein
MMTSANGRQTAGRRVSYFRLVCLLPAALCFLLFYFYPLFTILAQGSGEAGWQTYLDANTWKVLGFTIWQAALSTLATLVVGLPGAYLVAHYRFRGQGLLRALTAIPFVMPTLVVAAGFNALLGERGWINLGLTALGWPTIPFTGTLGAIILAHVFYNTTIVIRLVGDFWSHLDPRLTQAARMLGANSFATFWRVTWPLITPALLAAALLVFIFDFTSFGVILVLGGPGFATLEVEIYRQAFAFFNLPAAAALTFLQLICTFALTLVYTHLTNQVARPANLRSTAFSQQPLTALRQRLTAAVIIGLLLVLLLSPLVALAARSFVHLESNRGERAAVQPSLTFDYYRALFQNERGQAFFATPIKSMGNSVGYALLTVVLSLALGLPTAWVLSKQTDAVSETASVLMNATLMLPLGTSAITLGLGFLLAFSRPPFTWRASPLIIPLAHTLIAFPFVVRTLLPTWQSVRPSWRKAAATLGATPFDIWRRIDLPLIGRSALVAAAFAFALSLGEFGATALLTRPEFPTAAIAIYTYLGQPGDLNYGRALALSTLLMIVTAGSILLIEHLRLKGIAEF